MPVLGIRWMSVPDDGTDIQLLVFYPSEGSPVAVSVGRAEVAAVPDEPVQQGRYPLVLFSHGTGSAPYLLHTLAMQVVRQGYVAAVPAHPGNHRDDNSLANTAANLRNRPRHLRRCADFLLVHPDFAPVLLPDRYAIVGHSLGGYTALALAGGKPTSIAPASPQEHALPIPVAHDPRAAALVLLAPATVWFQAPDALQAVTCPVLMFTGGQDPHTPPIHAYIVQQGLPDPTQLTHHQVEGAGHFSFLMPFPPALISPQIPPSQDPPGFDRARFHTEILEPQLAAFLRHNLPPA